jgi:glutamine---fructose-6-phosphate transaminase (isomerizing)
MCGIVGYTGPGDVLPILLDGLGRLEYRGYDSAGVALAGSDGLWIRRRPGKLAELAGVVGDAPTDSIAGIGHTRWATHGGPTERNAHPHTDESGRLALVHNGIVEGYLGIRERLEAAGIELRSETDTELLAHLVALKLRHGGGLAEAVRQVLRETDGAMAIVVIHADEPDLIVAARKGPPLVAGFTADAGIVASDIPAMLAHTRDLVAVEDERVISVRPGSITAMDLDGNPVDLETRRIDWDYEQAEKGGFEHFMLKEIHEQPGVIEATLAGRTDDTGQLVLSELRLDPHLFKLIDRVSILGCGTSYHAALVAKYAIERWARLPCEIDLSSEYRYRDPVLDARTLVVGVSQSGETADTIEACRFANDLDAKVVAVSNVVGSTMSREADAVLYTQAGPEICVAATKTYLAQVCALELLGLYLAQVRGSLTPELITGLTGELHELPGKISEVLDRSHEIKAVAERLADASAYFFLGRGVSYPAALEGALKLKEITYRHAEGYAAGELKHGPIALIEPGVVVVGMVSRSRVHPKTLSNIQEVKARGATIVLVANERDAEAAALADILIEVPETNPLFSPAIDVVPLQLLAYWLARTLGTDIDQPRNLAKTVTVE